MNLEEIENLFSQELVHIYPCKEIENLFFLTIEEVLGINRLAFSFERKKN